MNEQQRRGLNRWDSARKTRSVPRLTKWWQKTTTPCGHGLIKISREADQILLDRLILCLRDVNIKVWTCRVEDKPVSYRWHADTVAAQQRAWIKTKTEKSTLTRAWRTFPKRNMCHIGSTCARACGWFEVLLSAWDWFGSFSPSLPSLFPASLARLPLGCFHMLMDGGGQLCGPTAWNSSTTKEKWRWKERGEKGTDRQRERESRQKWADAHQRPKSPSKEGPATRAQRPQGWLSTLVYADALC